MNNGRMEEGYLRWAQRTLDEAQHALKTAYYPAAVRRSQECVEMAVKGILRFLSVEFPKAHDVSSLLRAMPENIPLPAWLRGELEFIASAMEWLSERRGPSMYGDEERQIPPTELINLEMATRACKDAAEVLALCQRFDFEWRSRNRAR